MNTTFSRRPWDSMEHDFIRHVDGIGVTNITKGKAIYLCLHTSKAFLTDNQKQCASENGWWWRSLFLENFDVTNGIGCEGVFITDGVVPEVKIDVTIRNGKISNLDTDSLPICIEYVNSGTLTLESIILNGVLVPEINIKNCNIDLLIVRKCQNFKIKATGSLVKAIKLIGCSNVEIEGLDSIKPMISPTPSSLTDGIYASVAMNVIINGVLYTGTAKNITLHI